MMAYGSSGTAATLIENPAPSQGMRDLSRPVAPARGASPDDENADQSDSQSIPGDGILQMVVGERDDKLAGLRQTAGRYGRFLLDIERCNGGKIFRSGNCRRIAQEKQVVRGIVSRREPVPSIRPPQAADDFDRPRNLSSRARDGVLFVFRHEAAIDDHGAAVGE